MNKYDYLLRKRNKALGIFTSAKAKLVALTQQLEAEIQSCFKEVDLQRKQIDECNKRINEEHEASVYLVEQQDEIRVTVEKINAIIGA